MRVLQKETNVKSPVASLCFVCSSVKNLVRVMMSKLIFSVPVPVLASPLPFEAPFVAMLGQYGSCSRGQVRKRKRNGMKSDNEMRAASVEWRRSNRDETNVSLGEVEAHTSCFHLVEWEGFCYMYVWHRVVLYVSPPLLKH
jgi:hypothetical protein